MGCIQLACSWRPRAFEEAHRGNIQAKFYNEKFPLVYESDNAWDSLHEKHGATLKHNIWDSLHEEQGATLKHKCGKRDSSIALYSFRCFLFFGPFFFSFLLAFLFFFWPFFFFLWDNALIMMIITLLLITTHELQLETRTRYDSIWMPPAVYRDCAMNQERHVWKIMHGGFATNTMSTTWSCNGNMTKVMYVMMMINGTVESCMAIYLGMAMEMP